MVRAMTLRRLAARLAVILPIAALLYAPSPGWATPLLGPDLSTFAVLGATPSVTNTGATTLTGDVGVSPAASITGLIGITVNGTNGADGGNPFVHLNDATAISAQGQLGIARTNLGLMGPGTLLGVDLAGVILAPSLVGLPPGLYTVPAGVSNLTGTLTLDGLGNANAGWVFQMPSTLITSSGSVVNVINTGTGAGVYWNVGSSAILGSTTSFEGNILALTDITLITGATIGCGRALADGAQVIMDTNTINSIGCEGTGEEGSNGLSGGLTVPEGGGTPFFLPFVPVDDNGGVPVPEPSSFLLLLTTGLIGVAARMRRARRR